MRSASIQSRTARPRLVRSPSYRDHRISHKLQPAGKFRQSGAQTDAQVLKKVSTRLQDFEAQITAQVSAHGGCIAHSTNVLSNSFGLRVAMLYSEESFYEALRLTVDRCVRLFLLQSFPILPVGYILECPLVVFCPLFKFSLSTANYPRLLQSSREKNSKVGLCFGSRGM